MNISKINANITVNNNGNNAKNAHVNSTPSFQARVFFQDNIKHLGTNFLEVLRTAKNKEGGLESIGDDLVTFIFSRPYNFGAKAEQVDSLKINCEKLYSKPPKNLFYKFINLIYPEPPQKIVATTVIDNCKDVKDADVIINAAKKLLSSFTPQKHTYESLNI